MRVIMEGNMMIEYFSINLYKFNLSELSFDACQRYIDVFTIFFRIFF
jgi:hypothetical protein